ncbi:MAG: hypothetical protein ABWW70_02705 [Thermoproteota archaeon]
MVSVAILALVVITVGGFIASLVYGRVSASAAEIRERALEVQLSSEQALSVLAAYRNSTHAIVAVFTGDTPIEVLAVYVNGAPAPECKAKLSGGEEGAAEGFEIPENAICVIECPLSGSPPYTVKIVYGNALHLEVVVG